MAKTPKLTVVGTGVDDEPKKEYSDNFLEAFKDFMAQAEYLEQLQTDEVEAFVLVWVDATGYKIAGYTDNPHILKSHLGAAEWSMNFQEMIGDTYDEEG